MKLPLPNFLRKKVRSSKSSALSLSSFESNTVSSSSACTSSSSCQASSSEGSSWSKGLIQAQRVSASMDEIVVLHETSTEKVQSKFAPKLPSLDLHGELEEAFMRFDANHDGKISAMELGSILRSLGDNPSDEELLQMVKEADKDGDGFIDLQEFILLNDAASATGKEDLREAFHVFDADEDGKISVEELHHVLSRIGDSCTLEECGRMIRSVDTDGDGFVDFKEFCTMMSMQ